MLFAAARLAVSIKRFGRELGRNEEGRCGGLGIPFKFKVAEAGDSVLFFKFVVSGDRFLVLCLYFKQGQRFQV